jgi:hypothetical protein
MTAEVEPAVAWYETARFRRWCIIAFCVLIAIKAVHSIGFKDNDFAWHIDLGRTGLMGAPYVQENGGLTGTHYPPGRVVIDAALALLPYRLARAIVFFCAVGALLLTSRVWRRLADAMHPTSYDVHFAAAFFAFALLGQWVVRDLDDCGLQILLLFFLTMAGSAVWRGASLAAGAWLGLAITWKSTPLIFLPLLIWKRRWRDAAAALAFVLIFNVGVPALVWGPAAAQDALMRYLGEVRKVAALQDPSENGVEPPRPSNQNLSITIARFLQTYPPGNLLYVNSDYAHHTCAPNDTPATCPPHPLFVQFLDLPAATAKKIVSAILGIMALALAWRMRHAWSLAKDPPRDRATSALAPEWAAACAFAALLSPLTWLHHLSLALPCAYLAIRETLLFPSRSKYAALALVFVGTWLLQRDPLSYTLSAVAMSYHGQVFAMLILIVMTLADRHAISPAGKRQAAP